MSSQWLSRGLGFVDYSAAVRYSRCSFELLCLTFYSDKTSLINKNTYKNNNSGYYHYVHYILQFQYQLFLCQNRNLIASLLRKM